MYDTSLAISGPIVKDKAFFFFSYDQQKRDFPGLSIFSSSTFLNLSTATHCNHCAWCGGADRQCAELPHSISGPVPRTGDQKLFLPKLDWTINDKNTMTVSYNRLRWNHPRPFQTIATNTRAIDNFGDDFVNIDAVNVRLASTLTSNLLNEFRMQWGRDNEVQFSQPPPVNRRTLLADVHHKPSFRMVSRSVCPSFSSARRFRMSAAGSLPIP